jgi:AcrR family transcriptional regulator
MDEQQPTPAQQRKERTRELILRASLELAQEHGWAQLTLRRIAERIQYTHPALYAYFATKDELFVALLQRGLLLLYAELEAARLASQGPYQALRSMALAYWGFAWQHPELYQVMHGLGGVAFTNTAMRADERRVGEPVATALVELLAQRGQQVGDVDQKVTLLWSTIHGLITLTMAGRFERDDAAALVEQFLHDMMRGWGLAAEGEARDEPTQGPDSENTLPARTL